VLSPAQISEYFGSGYLVLERTYGPAEVRVLLEGFERLEARAQRLNESASLDGASFVVERRPTGALRIERIVWCGGAEPELLRLGQSKSITVPAAQLLGGPDLDQLINQAHIKNPGDGTTFHFHQDSYHRRYGTELFTDVNGRGSFVQALTAVDAMVDPSSPYLVQGRLTQADITAFVAERLARFGLSVDTATQVPKLYAYTRKLGEAAPFRTTEP